MPAIPVSFIIDTIQELTLAQDVEALNQFLITQHVDINYSVYTSYYGGHTALMQFAQNGNHQAVNFLLQFGAHRRDAVNGYERGGHLNLKNILFLLVSTEDEALRRLLANRMSEIQYGLIFYRLHRADHTNALLAKATQLMHKMREHGLSFVQVLSLSKIENKVWLLQGPQLLESGRLAINEKLLLARITSFLVASSIDEAYTIHENTHRFFSELSRYHPERSEETALTPSVTEITESPVDEANPMYSDIQGFPPTV